MYIDALLEEFNFDPFGSSSLDNFSDVTDMYESGIRFNEEIYQEASGIVKKKGNIFRRLWNFIVKAWNWIVERFNKLIKFISSKVRPKKSTDQILEEIGVKPSQTAPSQSSSVGNEAPEQSVSSNSAVSSASKQSRHSTQSKLKITAPDGTPAELAFKDLNTAFDENGNVTMRVKDVTSKNNAKAPVKATPVANVGWKSAVYVLRCIENPGLFEGYNKAAECVNDVIEYIKSKKDGVKMFDSYIIKKVNELTQNVGQARREITSRDIDREYTFSLGKIREFNDTLNKISDMINKANSNLTDDTLFNIDQFLNLFNSFCLDVDTLQMGVNTLTSALMDVFSVDARYYESIKDPEMLSKFAEKCVDASIPVKYITYNIFVLTTADIKGKGKKEKPVAGQSRAIFYPIPNEKIVYKVAVNKMGLRANANEILLTNAFRKDPEGEAIALITPTTYTSSNNYVIAAERVEDNSIGTADQLAIEHLKNKLLDACNRLNISRDTTGDIHVDNVGRIGNRAVCVDYGSIRATSRPKLS